MSQKVLQIKFWKQNQKRKLQCCVGHPGAGPDVYIHLSVDVNLLLAGSVHRCPHHISSVVLACTGTGDQWSVLCKCWCYLGPPTCRWEQRSQANWSNDPDHLIWHTQPSSLPPPAAGKPFVLHLRSVWRGVMLVTRQGHWHGYDHIVHSLKYSPPDHATPLHLYHSSFSQK